MAYGLVPVRALHGGDWSTNLQKCFIPSTDTNDMFVGDPVDLAGSANADATCPTVVRATAGANNPIFGVIVAFEPDPNDLTLRYRKASTARYCYVCTDPFVVYRIQAEPTNVLGPTHVGLNAVLYSGTGNTGTGLSGWAMDSGATTAPAANCTYQLLILKAVAQPGNDVTAAGAHWEVMISLHRLLPNALSGSVVGAKGV